MLCISSCSSHLLIYDKKLSNHPFFIQVTLGDMIFFKFIMIWVFFGIGGKKAMLCIFFFLLWIWGCACFYKELLKLSSGDVDFDLHKGVYG